MSNRATLQRTEFKNLPQGDTTFGWRIYDDYGQTYSNILSKEDVEKSDEELLQQVSSFGDEVSSVIIDFALEHGIYIGNQWYDADWVQKTLDC